MNSHNLFCENRSKILTFLANFVIHLSCGIPLYVGNASIYIYSYAYVMDLPGSGMSSEWMVSSFSTGRAVGIFVARGISSKLGDRLTMLLGLVLFSGSMLASYFSIKVSMELLLITFICVPAFAYGLMSAISFKYLVAWDEKNAGKVTSIVLISSSIGAGFANLFITGYINPENETPTGFQRSHKYFTDDKIISRVPWVFVYIGAFSIVTQIFGLLMMRENKKQQVSEETKLTQNLESSNLEMTHNHADSSLETTQNHVSACNDPKYESNENGREQRAMDKGKENEVSNPGLDMEPKMVIRSWLFYKLCLTMIASQVCSIIFFQHFKTFGQNWIADDDFLTSLGTSIAWTSILSRFLWAAMYDKFQTSITLFGYFTTLGLLFSWLYVSATLSRWAYFFVALSLGCASSGHQVIFVPIALISFGKKYFTTNFALLQCSTIILNFIIPEVSNYIQEDLGWVVLFSVVACVQLTMIFCITGNSRFFK